MGKIELVSLLSLSSRCLVIGDCCVALPRGVMGLSVVYDCGISLSYSLFFISNNELKQQNKLLLSMWSIWGFCA